MRTQRILAALCLTTFVLQPGCFASRPDATQDRRADGSIVADPAPHQRAAGESPISDAQEAGLARSTPVSEAMPAGDEKAEMREPTSSTASPKAKKDGGRTAGAIARPGPGWHAAPPVDQPDNEAYSAIEDNQFLAVADDPLSTFSIDVDTASYSNVRRFVEDGTLPPADAVRIEEMINYFDYGYRQPSGADPFSVTSEVSACPWNQEHLLVHVGLQGKALDQAEVPARNLVFLLDVSGSMNSPDKLPLVKRALGLIGDNLRPQDRVSIVVYAGASGVVLEPTADRTAVLAAIDRLESGGSTNGGAGILSAYKLAEKSFVEGGINRVILATDGDFNVGATSEGELVRMIEEKRKSGVFLSVLGFGTGNLKDATMEMLADKGNGNYAYIDSIAEARKVLVEEAGGTLVTIAKDVKLQVEFNPTQVASYRLIGYENRKLAHADFNDDAKDAGEIGAGHSVTALYEIAPAGAAEGRAGIDSLKYQKDRSLADAAKTGELMTIKIRYKKPSESESILLSHTVESDDRSLERTSDDFRFSAAVAEMGMLLRDSKHKGTATWAQTRELAAGALGEDPHGHRSALLALLDKARALSVKDGVR